MGGRIPLDDRGKFLHRKVPLRLFQNILTVGRVEAIMAHVKYGTPLLFWVQWSFLNAPHCIFGAAIFTSQLLSLMSISPHH
jgi:hypothetical protein